MSFDALIANPGRLKILTALAVEERQEFVDLRRRTSLTDGNLAAHAKRLQGGGFIAIDKQFRQGKPVTSFVLTPEGRRALEAHVRRLISALSQRRTPSLSASTDEQNSSTIASPLHPVRRQSPAKAISPSDHIVEEAAVATLEVEDDWID